MSFLKSFNKVYKFTDADEALQCITELYDAGRNHLLEEFDAFSKGKDFPTERITECYPYLKIKVDNAKRIDSRLSYGFVPRPGTYSTTLTRPDIFGHYYREQIRLLLKNHQCRSTSSWVRISTLKVT